MKCQRCPKQATLHITEVLGEERFEELHLCEDCAKKYLYEPQMKKAAEGAEGGEAEDAGTLGEKQCDACGLKFVEFRNNGRLGCPHDYDAFKDDLLPLLESIHGDVKHVGKSPRRLPKAKAAPARADASCAASSSRPSCDEDYEEAARLRDQIRVAEEEQG